MAKQNNMTAPFDKALGAFIAIQQFTDAEKAAIAKLSALGSIIGHDNARLFATGAHNIATSNHIGTPQQDYQALLMMQAETEGPDSPLWAQFDHPKCDPGAKLMADARRAALRAASADKAQAQEAAQSATGELRKQLKTLIAQNGGPKRPKTYIAGDGTAADISAMGTDALRSAIADVEALVAAKQAE